MPKCCSYGIPNDPQGDVVRFTLCVPDGQPCPQFAALRNMGSRTVKDCAGCKPPTAEPRPKLRCCAYGLPNDPSGRVVRWRVCLPSKVKCPKLAGLRNLGSRLVTSCNNCCGATKRFPIKRTLLKQMRASVRRATRAKPR